MKVRLNLSKNVTYWQDEIVESFAEAIPQGRLIMILAGNEFLDNYGVLGKENVKLYASWREIIKTLSLNEDIKNARKDPSSDVSLSMLPLKEVFDGVA